MLIKNDVIQKATELFEGNESAVLNWCNELKYFECHIFCNVKKAQVCRVVCGVNRCNESEYKGDLYSGYWLVKTLSTFEKIE